MHGVCMHEKWFKSIPSHRSYVHLADRGKIPQTISFDSSSSIHAEALGVFHVSIDLDSGFVSRDTVPSAELHKSHFGLTPSTSKSHGQGSIPSSFKGKGSMASGPSKSLSYSTSSSSKTLPQQRSSDPLSGTIPFVSPPHDSLSVPSTPSLPMVHGSVPSPCAIEYSVHTSLKKSKSSMRPRVVTTKISQQKLSCNIQFVL
ncbi:putative protein TPRXL [Cucumis sativus]|uniref:putative protein TPRXL n=1 Tax=Cucumis sativus TaxID=3659 RepID=UPI0012F49C49|nr:putative protein TPRXL [Cucumis sativus]